MNKTFFCLLLFGLGNFQLFGARIKGKVTDPSGAGLPFLTIVVKGTTQGTTTNSEGEYFLSLPSGQYELVFRYVGYQTLSRQVEVGKEDLLLNVQMAEEITTLKTVVVNADAEDYAYTVIRNAQDKRKFYLNQVDELKCKVYIKGLQRITEAPKKILGMDITIPGAENDSVNSGIVYLSESVSEYAQQAPNRKKERMISSKTSGQNNAFSWNSALDFDFNFYQPSIDAGELSSRNFISPIAPTSMLYYDFKYEGDFKENNVTVNKIKVTPKREGLPAFSGYLYIQEDSWRIHSTELYVTKKLNNVEYVDSLLIKQVYLPVSEDVWVMGTQTFEYKFTFNLFKIKGDGYYLGIFSDYNLTPKFPKNYFNAELSLVEEGANQKDSAYWVDIRPVKLTDLEVWDYQRKDSIAVVRASKVFKDSVDSVRNKPKPIHLLTGYTYRNSYKNFVLGFPSVLENIQYNTVEGYSLNAGVRVSRYNREKNKYILFAQDFRYGFSSKDFYFRSNFYRRFNGVNRRQIRLQVGKFVQQFNDNEPITPFINTIYSLFREQNFMKLYERTYAKFSYGQELFNGVYLVGSAEYANRKPLMNTSNSSLRDVSGREFTSNNPIEPEDFSPFFEAHRAFLVDARLTVRFGQKYYRRPNLKYATESKWPTLSIYYQKGIEDVGNSITDFDFLKGTISDDFKLGLFGRSELNLSYGGFLSMGNVPFIDAKHFMTTQTVFSNNTLTSFFNLPYYQFSTTDDFFEGHFEHHFGGFFFQKVPFLRKLKWQIVAGAHALYTDDTKEYWEVNAGIENIFKVGRLDWAMSRGNLVATDHVLRFRIGF